jgi:hypothetical protein
MAMHDAASVKRAYLDEVLPLSLSDKRLELGRGECVDETGL